MLTSKDIFGKALMDYYDNHVQLKSKNLPEDILTWTNISEIDALQLTYLFRSYDEMPKVEQKALELSRGKILDVGCGSGSHSLYLQEKGHDIHAIDISKGAVTTSKKRGVLNIQQIALLEVRDKYDTILLLMNGTGIFQEFDNIQVYLKHLKSILNPNGQILIDSSDIMYMFDDKKDIDENFSHYYGELDYFISYKGEKEIPMKWLYLDYISLKKASLEVGLHCSKVMDGEHFDYLAKLTLN